MRYFTKELWLRMNSDNEDERKAAEVLWTENTKKYRNDLEIVKKLFPKLFEEIDWQNEDFHDLPFSEIAFFQRNGRKNCRVKLLATDRTIVFTMHEISRFDCSISDFQWSVIGQLHWGYSEVECVNDGNIKLSVLCDPANEIQFEFKKLTGKSYYGAVTGSICSK